MSTAIVSNDLQGIGSVLGSSEIQRSKTAASLRRTLSADMSSKKWLSKNGFSPLKRIASTEEFQTVSEKKEDEPPGQSDIWSKIVAQKSVSLPSPYVHPLAKRSRSLSQQSLEICTESLGSETGSDGFSLSSPSETSDEESEETIEEEVEEEEEVAPVVYKQEFGAVNYSSSVKKSSLPRSFPPPLPSLSQSGLHVRSRRVEGRLVLEAVSAPAPPQNYFQAQREGGRLLLTLANPLPKESESKKMVYPVIEDKEEEEMFEEAMEEEEEEGEDEGEGEFEEEEEIMNQSVVMEMKVSQPTKRMPTGVINVHRSAVMVNKLMGLTNIDPTWSPKLQKLDCGCGDQTLPYAQSLPPLVGRFVPSSTVASSFNTYDYCWRTKSVAAAPPPTVCTHPLTQNPLPINKNNNFLRPKNNLNHQNQPEMVLMKGNNNNEYLVPVFNGCKEPKRSLFIWEAPHCIATS